MIRSLRTPLGLIAAMVIALFSPVVRAQDKKDPSEKEASTSYAQVLRDYNQAMLAYRKSYTAAKTAEDRRAAMKAYPKADDYAKRYVEIARKHPETEAAIRSLSAALRLSYYSPISKEILAKLADHAANPSIADSFGMLPYSPHRQQASALLQKVRAENENARAKGLATYYLALVYRRSTNEKQKKEAETLLEDVDKNFRDVKLGRGTLADLAGRELFEIRNLTVGKVAPEITGEDIDGKRFNLSEYRGKVVFLDFWGDW